MNAQPTCNERIDDELEYTTETIQAILDAPDWNHEDHGSLYDFGLSFDYVEPETFTDQLEGYWRWQLSYGGPSDEFRAYVNPDGSIHRLEYWFLDWFDGAHRRLDRNHPAWDIMQDWIEINQ